MVSTGFLEAMDFLGRALADKLVRARPNLKAQRIDQATRTNNAIHAAVASRDKIATDETAISFGSPIASCAGMGSGVAEKCEVCAKFGVMKFIVEHPVG
jgi:hypothetical protein